MLWNQLFNLRLSRMPTPKKRTGFGTMVKNTIAKLRGTTRKVKHLHAVIQPSRYNIMNSEQRDKYMKMIVPDVYILKPEYATLKDRITMAEHGIWYPLEEWEYRGMDEYEKDEELKKKAFKMLRDKLNNNFVKGTTEGGKYSTKKARRTRR